MVFFCTILWLLITGLVLGSLFDKPRFSVWNGRFSLGNRITTRITTPEIGISPSGIVLQLGLLPPKSAFLPRESYYNSDYYPRNRRFSLGNRIATRITTPEIGISLWGIVLQLGLLPPKSAFLSGESYCNSDYYPRNRHFSLGNRTATRITTPEIGVSPSGIVLQLGLLPPKSAFLPRESYCNSDYYLRNRRFSLGNRTAIL